MVDITIPGVPMDITVGDILTTVVPTGVDIITDITMVTTTATTDMETLIATVTWTTGIITGMHHPPTPVTEDPKDL